jgi:hypothetical protein
VALGNALRAGAGDEVESALRERLGHASPLVCEHIEWALAQRRAQAVAA